MLLFAVCYHGSALSHVLCLSLWCDDRLIWLTIHPALLFLCVCVCLCAAAGCGHVSEAWIAVDAV